MAIKGMTGQYFEASKVALRSERATSSKAICSIRRTKRALLLFIDLSPKVPSRSLAAGRLFSLQSSDSALLRSSALHAAVMAIAREPKAALDGQGDEAER